MIPLEGRVGVLEGHRYEPLAIDRQDAASFSYDWKGGEEELGPCLGAIETRREDKCSARIGQLSFFTSLLSQRLVRPRLFLARLVG